MKPLTREWVSKAEGDYATARREVRARRQPNFDAACFHAQQCAEKYIKALFYSNRARGERARRAWANGAKTTAAPSEQPNTELAARVKATWARLIRG